MSIKEKIKKAFDTGTANSELVHLNPTQADKFIDYIVDESKIMQDANVVRMTTPTKKVAEIDINDDIFVPGVHATEVDETIKASAMKKELVSKEIVGMVTIFDNELDDNIEGNAFKDHLMRMIAKKGATQLEKVGMYAKKVDAPVSLMGMFDGFITQIKKNGGSVLDATDTNIFADRYIDRTKMSKLYKSVEEKYRELIDVLYVPGNIMLDYEDKYLEGNTRVPTDRLGKLGFTEANIIGRSRAVPKTSGFATELSSDVTAGDTTADVDSATGITAGASIAFALDNGQEHITKVVSVSTNTITVADAFTYDIDSSSATINKVVEVLTDAVDVLIMAKNNMLYGIQKDITIEPERKARLRATHFIFTARIDVLLLNPNLCALLEGVKSR